VPQVYPWAVLSCAPFRGQCRQCSDGRRGYEWRLGNALLGGRPSQARRAEPDGLGAVLWEPSRLPDIMRIPLLGGRFITSQDNENSPCVAVIDEEFQRKAFPAQFAIGAAVGLAVTRLMRDLLFGGYRGRPRHVCSSRAVVNSRDVAGQLHSGTACNENRSDGSAAPRMKGSRSKQCFRCSTAGKFTFLQVSDNSNLER